MPYLEYLRIERYQPEYPQAISRNEMETSLPKISTPRLCELTVKGRVWRDLMRLDTSALTVFSTDTPDVVTILGVLQRSPKLEILNLRYPDSMYFADPRMTTMIQMTTSRIRSLQVELREDSEPSFLFDFLHLPSLTLLKVSGVYEFSWPEASEAIAQSLVNLLRRSQPPLVTLDNQRMNLSSVQLRDIMELCPSITTLCLGSCDFYFHGQLVSTISLPLLTVPVSTPPLLPNLSNLTFYDVGHIDFDELVMMLESRQNWRRPGETEQEQRFKSELTCYNLTEDQQKHLAGLSNERMTVTVNGLPIELCAECHSSFPASNDFVFDKILKHIRRKSPNGFCHTHELQIFEPLAKEAEDKLSSYDLALDQLRDTLERLERQRRDLWMLKEQLRGLIKPSIRRLPTEVSLHIFPLCKEPEWGPSQCDASLILSHVCAPWRSMIFSEPSLWTDIFVGFGLRDNDAAAQRILAFTQFCLDKSRARPLYVEFETPNRGDYRSLGYRNSDNKWVLYPKGLHRPCLEEVCRHSNRWKHATLRIHGCDSLDFADTMPCLEFLQIERADRRHDDDPETTRSFPKISITPRLRELTIKDRAESDLMRLDTSALTIFSTDTLDVNIILDALRRSPKLEILDLRPPRTTYSDISFFADPRTTMMTCNIHTLEVYGDNVPDALFDFLHLPSLTFLRLSGDYGFRLDSLSFVNLLRRSRPPLVTLDIRSMSFSSNELGDVMELCPSITTLCLGACCDYPIFERRVSTLSLPLLTVPVSTPPLLPNLSDLTFYDVMYMNIDMLVMMLESRQNWSRPGETEQEQHFVFELNGSNSWLRENENDEKRLVGLSNEKMTVTVSRSRGG
ncbi:hypothetical protein VNI00_013744 [Paramarasmius palmivorus]|uniref:F-box domain-containing protein n=1 Tax=Paramarasmius palmivorus TaxID=297713 RepID=A0AAW0BWI8_9AGAR